MQQRVRDVCDAVGGFIEYWGFKAIHGRVWTMLALRSEPVSQAELARELEVSRSLISGTMAELTSYGLVRACGEQRNAPYEAVVDVWPTISDVLRSREWMLVESARLALEAAADELHFGGSPEDNERYDLGRIRLLLSFTESAQTFLRMLMAIRVPRPAEGMGRWIARASSLVKSLANQPRG